MPSVCASMFEYGWNMNDKRLMDRPRRIATSIQSTCGGGKDSVSLCIVFRHRYYQRHCLLIPSLFSYVRAYLSIYLSIYLPTSLPPV